MTYRQSLIISFRYIRLTQLARALQLIHDFTPGTLKNLRSQVRQDVAEGLCRIIEGDLTGRKDVVLASHETRGQDTPHALAVTEEILKLYEWNKNLGYKLTFRLTPNYDGLIPDAEVLLQLEDKYSLLFLELERQGRPKLDKYIAHQEKIKTEIEHRLGRGRKAEDFHFHLGVVSV